MDMHREKDAGDLYEYLMCVPGPAEEVPCVVLRLCEIVSDLQREVATLRAQTVPAEASR